MQDGAINQSHTFCGMPRNVPRCPSETGILAPIKTEHLVFQRVVYRHFYGVFDYYLLLLLVVVIVVLVK